MSSHANEEHTFPYYRSPAAIREETFAHRMRGLDEAEVYEYLDLLADQVQTAETEHAELRAENRRLRAEVDQLRGGSPPVVTSLPPDGDGQTTSPTAPAVPTAAQPQTPPVAAHGDLEAQSVALFRQAQQVADQLVEEAVRRASDLMSAARAEEREILRQARSTAEAAARELRRAEAAHQSAEAAARELRIADARHAGIYQAPPGPDAEYVRTLAKVAQAQLRAVLGAVADEVDKLGELPAPSYPRLELPAQGGPAPWEGWQGGGEVRRWGSEHD